MVLKSKVNKMFIPDYYLDLNNVSLQINIHTCLRKSFDDSLTTLLYIAINRDCDMKIGNQYILVQYFKKRLAEISIYADKYCEKRKITKKELIKRCFKESIKDICDEYSPYNFKTEIDKKDWDWDKKVLYMLWLSFRENDNFVDILIENIFPTEKE